MIKIYMRNGQIYTINEFRDYQYDGKYFNVMNMLGAWTDFYNLECVEHISVIIHTPESNNTIEDVEE